MDQISCMIVCRRDILQAKDSRSEWGDGKVSISKFLEVSEEGNSMNFWFFGLFVFF